MLPMHAVALEQPANKSTPPTGVHRLEVWEVRRMRPTFAKRGAPGVGRRAEWKIPGLPARPPAPGDLGDHVGICGIASGLLRRARSVVVLRTSRDHGRSRVFLICP